MSTAETVKAFCYLERINDERNKISLTEESLIINYRNRPERFDLTQVKNLIFEPKKAMLYVIGGGITVPFTALAFYRDFLDPWPTLFLLLGGVFALYHGWRGYQVLSVQLFGVTRDYKLREVSSNIRAFVDFTINLLPTNQPLTDQREHMIYHITDLNTWKKYQSGSHYRIKKPDRFIHASRYRQLDQTLKKHFSGKSQLLLLTIDPLKVDPEVRFEDLLGEGQLFPHIYGDLNLDAVVKVEEI